jgi:hypothetical protein
MDLAVGFGPVTLPDALVRKFPNAPIDWAWQFVFQPDASVAMSGSGHRPGFTCMSP